MFHPDLRLLRCFAAIAETGSVTRAAERLHLSQPTVSGQIREFEQSLGFPLLHRTSRSVTLSAQGTRLLPLVHDILSRAEAFRREAEEMQQRRERRFRMGAAMYSMDFPERITLLDAFADAAPDYRYIIDNRLQTNQVPDLLSGDLDVALLLGIAISNWEDEPASDKHGAIIKETLYPDQLQRVVLQSKRMGVLVPRTSVLAEMDVIPRSALVGQSIAVLSSEHGHAMVDPINDFLTGSGANLVKLSEGNALAIERYAERTGICALNTGWFPALPGLVPRDVEGMEFHMDFAVVLGASPNRAARIFFDFARKWADERSGLSNFETLRSIAPQHG